MTSAARPSLPGRWDDRVAGPDNSTVTVPMTRVTDTTAVVTAGAEIDDER